MNDNGMPTNGSFLGHLAREYSKLEPLENYLFVFPNRRAGKFFIKYLLDNGVEKKPLTVSVGDFFERLSGLSSQDKIEQIFLLYDCYKSLKNEVCPEADDVPFERFVTYADVIISDFSNIDSCLIDAEQVLANSYQYSSLKTDYLDDEQVETLNRYFRFSHGVLAAHGSNDADDMARFWGKDETTDGYFSIPENLYLLYKRFNEELLARKMSYPGAMSRLLCDRLALGKIDLSDFKFFNRSVRKIVFVGFNVLTRAEQRIFTHFKNASDGFAAFHWDNNSPVFNVSEEMPVYKGAEYLSNQKDFPNDNGIAKEPIITEFPNIEVMGVPSNIGQVKYVSSLLTDNKFGTNKDDAIDTAVVLADENLLTPLIYSIDPDYTSVNVTMNYSLKGSVVTTLVGGVQKLMRTATKKGTCFYYKDFLEFLNHPLVIRYLQDEAEKMVHHISSNSLVAIGKSDFDDYPRLVQLFDSLSAIRGMDIVDKLKEFVNLFADCTVSEIEKHSFKEYVNVMGQIGDSLSAHNHNEPDLSLLIYLIDRILRNIKMSFEGEPLRGLQVMGVLETRCLDFENVIMVSMNERIFPRKSFTRSFIPNIIRKSFGMNTDENQEAIYSYYFYRLISRAKNVYLVYDSRTSSRSSGEYSRFIEQLKRIHKNSGIRFHSLSTRVSLTANSEISVPKTPRILKKLESYLTPGGKSLSASAINQYLQCPLLFYLSRVEGLGEITEVSEHMDYSQFGTVVHGVLEKIYCDKKPDGYTVDEVNQRRAYIEGYIDELIAANFLNYANNQGETAILRNIINKVVNDVLDYDVRLIERTDDKRLRILSLEHEDNCRLALGDVTVNFKYYIDRVDQIREGGRDVVRIVDYKTGGDETEMLTGANVSFIDKTKSYKKALVQLYLYSRAFAERSNYGVIRPMIYKVMQTRLSGVKIASKQIGDYRDFGCDGIFESEVFPKIAELFDKDVPFKQTTIDKYCKYCSFRDICKKENG